LKSLTFSVDFERISSCLLIYVWFVASTNDITRSCGLISVKLVEAVAESLAVFSRESSL